MAKITVSIIVPVLNEQKTINTLISHVKSIDSAISTELIVVDGDKESSTLNAIQDKNVIGIHSQPGRAIQMNKGAALAQGEILLFLHADTLLPPQAFSLMQQSLNHKRQAGAFRLRIDSPRLFLRLASAFTNIRSHIGRTPYGDQAQFFKKRYFETIGKYKIMPLFEDLEIMQRIRKRKEKIAIIKREVRTSARRWEKEGMLYGTFRNQLISFLFNIGVSPERLVKYYRNQ